MKQKGIKDIDSKEAIDLCLGCSLSKCELDVGKHRIKKALLVKEAKKLDGDGLGIGEIARRLSKNSRTIQRYLKEVGIK